MIQPTPDNSKWQPVVNPDNPLAGMKSIEVPGYRLEVVEGRRNRFGARYFRILLYSGSGQGEAEPFITGLYHRGRYPAQNWFEIIHVTPEIKPKNGRDLLLGIASPITLQIFKVMVDTLPPGGHAMVEYDSPAQAETARALGAGIPPAATPTGFTLFMAGCRAGFKDWYFAEGGSEGPRKLQAYKPLNDQHLKQKALIMARELEAFLANPVRQKGLGAAEPSVDRAREVLAVLHNTVSQSQYP